MADLDCLNSENELDSSLNSANEVQSQLNSDVLNSELSENNEISSVLAIDEIESDMDFEESADSNIAEESQMESDLDIPSYSSGDVEVPTKLSELENDVGFITIDDIPKFPELPENLSDFNNDVGFITKDDLPETPKIPERLSEFVNDGDGSSPFATEAFVLQNAGSGGESGPTVPVVDNLTSLSTTSALSANQGRILNEKISEIDKKTPTNISDLNNDAGFVSKTVSDLENYTTTDKMNEALNNKADKTEIPDISGKADRTEIPDISGKVDKSELTDYVSKEELQKENFLKEIPSEYVTEEELSSAISNKADKSDIPDISGKADKSELENYVTNDSLEEKGYLSSVPDEYVTEQELEGKNYATKTDLSNSETKTLGSANSYTDEKVASLIDSAPETLDTFKEIADAFAEDRAILDTLNSAIGNKADKTALTETNLRVASLETDNTQNKTDIKSLQDNKANKSEIPDISGKVDKVEGKGLSTNDYTSEEKTKLAGIEDGANNYDDIEIRISLSGKADKSDTYTKTEVDELITEVVVDDVLSETSENPVQNKVVTNAIANTVTIDTEQTITASKTLEYCGLKHTTIANPSSSNGSIFSSFPSVYDRNGNNLGGMEFQYNNLNKWFGMALYAGVAQDVHHYPNKSLGIYKDANGNTITQAPTPSGSNNNEIATTGYVNESLGEYVTESELNSKGYLTSVPSQFITETELENRLENFTSGTIITIRRWS